MNQNERQEYDLANLEKLVTALEASRNLRQALEICKASDTKYVPGIIALHAVSDTSHWFDNENSIRDAAGASAWDLFKRGVNVKWWAERIGNFTQYVGDDIITVTPEDFRR